MDWADSNGIGYIFGFAGNTKLDALVAETADDLRLRHALGTEDKLRWYESFEYRAKSWLKSRRVVARLEVSLQPDTGQDGMRQEVDIRYVVTSMEGTAQHLYETVYCAWPGREPDQAAQGAAGVGSHLMPFARGQSGAPRAAHGGLLDHAHAARCRAEDEPARHRRVRHAAPTPDQDCGPHCRARQPHPRAPAHSLSRAGRVRGPGLGTDARRGLSGGAKRPGQPPHEGPSNPNTLHPEV